jgi:hypothetical protein
LEEVLAEVGLVDKVEEELGKVLVGMESYEG